MDKWVEANIYYNSSKPNELLLGFIKPLVVDLEGEGKLSSFHVLGEPGPRLLLRILSTDEFFDEIVVTINSWVLPDDVRVEFRVYNGEVEKFGDAWSSVYRVMEAGTRCRLDTIDDSVSKTTDYNVIALNHYFLNSFGMNVYEEAVAHSEMVINRIVVLEQYRHNDLLTIVNQLIDEKLRTIAHA